MRSSALGASLLDLIFVDESVAASVRKRLRRNEWKWAGPCLTDTLPSLSTERSAFCGWPCRLCGSMDSAWAFVPVHVCWGQSQQELQDQENSRPLPLSLHTPVSIHANRPLFQTHPLFRLRTIFCSSALNGSLQLSTSSSLVPFLLPTLLPPCSFSSWAKSIDNAFCCLSHLTVECRTGDRRTDMNIWEPERKRL